ncbi:hypothetical protein BJ508DRAFT_417688 [Ascobolus immersus RN42]|uniref:Uncharacterized protein n=1 Tax=Ascobolus immersus RN42 TaxID=1160509 RepID=A0A3N4HTB5_ASCIM|nr:hypothetical protein BJ508DRAFT_417688 [Ascobolus immersus RN42]
MTSFPNTSFEYRMERLWDVPEYIAADSYIVLMNVFSDLASDLDNGRLQKAATHLYKAFRDPSDRYTNAKLRFHDCRTKAKRPCSSETAELSEGCNYIYRLNSMKGESSSVPGDESVDPTRGPAWEAIRRWNGHYSAESKQLGYTGRMTVHIPLGHIAFPEKNAPGNQFRDYTTVEYVSAVLVRESIFEPYYSDNISGISVQRLDELDPYHAEISMLRGNSFWFLQGIEYERWIVNKYNSERKSPRGPESLQEHRADTSYPKERLYLLLLFYKEAFLLFEHLRELQKPIERKLHELISVWMLREVRSTIKAFLLKNEERRAIAENVYFFTTLIGFLHDSRLPSVEERICRYLDS